MWIHFGGIHGTVRLHEKGVHVHGTNELETFMRPAGILEGGSWESVVRWVVLLRTGRSERRYGAMNRPCSMKKGLRNSENGSDICDKARQTIKQRQPGEDPGCSNGKSIEFVPSRVIVYFQLPVSARKSIE